MNAPDAFALGGRDPIIELAKELDRLDAVCKALSDTDPVGSDAASFRMVEVEDQIRPLVPTSITGIRRQLELLAQWAQDLEWSEDLQGALVDNILAGLRALEEVTP